MVRNIMFLLCVWTSISVFSKTTIYWNIYDKIAGMNAEKLNFPSIFIDTED